MSASASRVRVYTLPDCPKCSVLKHQLEERRVEFDIRSLDTEAQLELIMKNVFGNPPILEIGESVLSSDELFHDEVLDEKKLNEVLLVAEA
ncbi:MAG: NrdH-redoxin [Candidatus Bathyarchaeota archaeon]|nr:MAG: NrdH-redoxin [Candidatus Bathyarchaeota archaeon]